MEVISPAQFLASRIKAAIQIFDGDFGGAEIILKACYPKYSTHYTSAVCFALAQSTGKAPGAIAPVLASQIQVQQTSNPLPINFEVTAAREGWLNFNLQDIFLAELLSNLHDWGLKSLNRKSPQPFPAKAIATTSNRYACVQYAYARCCALLRLAEREKIVPDRDNFSWQLLNASGQLFLREEAEMKLVFILLAIADEFALHNGLTNKLPSQIALKLCDKLATDFLTFYDRCRIVSANRNVAIARLGLISSTQKAIAVLASGYMDLPREL